MLEKLDRSFVLFRRFTGFEGAEVPAPPRFGVFLARIQPVFPG
jgi:hypothetical protein